MLLRLIEERTVARMEEFCICSVITISLQQVTSTTIILGQVHTVTQIKANYGNN